MMELSYYKKQLLGFVETLKEANKIFLLLYTLLLLTNFLSLRPLVTDLLVKQSFLLVTSPTGTEFASLLIGMQSDFRLFVGVELVFILAFSASSVLFSSATVIASALGHTGQGQGDLSRPKDVALAAARCWKRPFITYFYISIFSVGYMFLVLAILVPVLMPKASVPIIVISICAELLYAYVAIVWTMGMVMSVLEEKSGMEALGKAGQLVKAAGMELKGYCLSLLVTLVSLGMMQIWQLAIGRSAYGQLLMGLALVNSLWLVRMYGLTGFTVLYHEGKQSLGEETTDMVVGLDYTKIPSLPMMETENLP